MIMVILGHASSPVTPLFYVFHVPLFFFLSGYLFNEQRYGNLRAVFADKAKILLLPYCILGLFDTLLYLPCRAPYTAANWQDALLPFVGLLAGIRNTWWMAQIGPFWFLTCLLVTEILFCLLLQWTRRGVPRIAVLSLLAAAGFLYGHMEAPLLPWSIDVAPIALIFFYAGNAARSRLAGLLQSSWLPVLACAGFLVGTYNGYRLTHTTYGADMYIDAYGNPALFLIGAFSGIYGLLYVVSRAPTFWPVNLMGRYSVAYLCLHQFPVFYLLDVAYRHILPAALKGQLTDTKLKFEIYRTVISTTDLVVSFVVIAVATELLLRYFPLALGIRKSSSMAAGTPPGAARA